jgi:precorrin-3B synthase
MARTLTRNLATSTPDPSRQGGGGLRRGACPGLSAPMPTGDGLLVRLLPVATIPLDAFGTLCAAAREHGNGIIEITARGSIQIRGLNAASAPRFADAVAALDIAAEDGVPVLSNALAGLDPEEILDAGGLAAELRHALAKTSLAARLAPKISVAIDGGGASGFGDLAADVRLCAEATKNGAVLRISVGGDGMSAATLGTVAAKQSAETAVRLLEVIARHGRAARARDLVAANGIAAFRDAVGDVLTTDTASRRPRPAREPIGTHRLRDGTVAYGIGLAFGHADAAALEHLADAARSWGAVGLRAAPARALMIIGVAPEAAPSVAAVAEKLGFIVRADDPRRHVIACAGAPICSSAHIAARAMAPRIAAIAAPHLAASFAIHVSGCGKGCAHAKAAALTIVGAPHGCALIANGSVRDKPFNTVATDELPAAVERYARTTQCEVGHV